MKGVNINDYQVYYNSDFYAPWGASQSTVAKLLGRCRKTISSRLKDTVSKKQRFTYSTIADDYIQAHNLIMAGGLLPCEGEEALRNFNRYIISTKDNSTVFKKYCNLYDISCWQLGRANNNEKATKVIL